VEPLGGGAAVFGPALLAEGLKHRGDGGGALRSQISGQAPGPAHGGVELQEPLFEALAVRVLIGVPGAPGLVGGLRDDPQVVESAPACAASRMIWSACCRSSWSPIRPVQPAISRASEMAAASPEAIAPIAARASPHAAPSRSRAAGEFR
jgi:hypothetical protein